jgi:dTDP-glucose 4,6-dehydratase
VEPDAFIKTDVYGTYVLLEAARRHGLERYHQVSTDEVYGDIPPGGSSLETDPLQPRSPYSASKAGGDLQCLAYYTSFGVPVTITRGSNNIGPYQYPEKVVPLFVTNAIDDLPLPLYGDGRQMRDYQYVLDHCTGIDTVLHKGELGQIYNVGTGSELTNIEMTRIVLATLGKPESLIRHVEDRPGHDRRYALDVRKLRALGWDNAFTCEQAVEKTTRWYADNAWWWQPVKSGDLYKSYYALQYAKRLGEA